MPGGLLQLVAYGAQDAYLSGNPQITFWKGLYKRHTNFAMEPFRVNLTGQANWGVKHSAILGRHADLLYSTYIEVVLDDGYYNNDQGRLGYNLIKYVELDIGGQIIDRIYGEWLYLWDALTSDFNTSVKLWRMVGNEEQSGAREITNSETCANGRLSSPKVLYIPLYFFYTKNPGAALPLIALQYHEVKINIQWNDVKLISGNFINNTVYSSTNDEGFPKQPLQASVYVDYIYLDTEERRRMAQQSHEYLIEQTQYNEDKGISSYNNRIDLTFNHPVKELVWVVQPSEYTNCKLTPEGTTRDATRLEPFTYDQAAIFDQWLQINGQDRLDKRYGDYYNKVQPYQHHTGVMGTQQDISGSGVTIPLPQPGIYCYSFALRPEEHQPSGTCNFSRIDTATIVMNLSGDATLDPDADRTYEVRVYAVNYNILRVMSGMAGLAYSN
jgi:Large eukaryotic DNA virus major capsid protein/Major capsid protein N-terminus